MRDTPWRPRTPPIFGLRGAVQLKEIHVRLGLPQKTDSELLTKVSSSRKQIIHWPPRLCRERGRATIKEASIHGRPPADQAAINCPSSRSTPASIASRTASDGVRAL